MATIYDVAERAGVSIATVSRVFSGSQDVRQDTRQRVIESARAMNYQPNALARNLRRADKDTAELTYTVGIVFHTVFSDDPFSIEIATAIEHALREHGYRERIIICSPEGDIPREIVNGEIDGAICRSVGPVVKAISERIPTVTLDYSGLNMDFYSVVPDYREGTFEVTQRLLACGHRKIVLVCEDPAETGDFGADQVTEGCLKAYRDEGIVPPKNLHAGRAVNAEQGYQKGQEIFAKTSPDVVLASDGAMPGVYLAAFERGLRIPEDISMIGIDGLNQSMYLTPPLTTISVDFHRLAESAARIVVECASKNKKVRGVELTPVHLIERSSAKLAPISSEAGAGKQQKSG